MWSLSFVNFPLELWYVIMYCMSHWLPTRSLDQAHWARRFNHSFVIDTRARATGGAGSRKDWKANTTQRRHNVDTSFTTFLTNWANASYFDLGHGTSSWISLNYAIGFDMVWLVWFEACQLQMLWQLGTVLGGFAQGLGSPGGDEDKAMTRQWQSPAPQEDATPCLLFTPCSSTKILNVSSCKEILTSLASGCVHWSLFPAPSVEQWSCSACGSCRWCLRWNGAWKAIRAGLGS